MDKETIVIERELKPLTKKCARCWKTFDVSSFPLRKNKHIGVCRNCYQEHYGNPDDIDQRQKIVDKRHQANRLDRSRAIVSERIKCGCMDCGEKNPVVLEFDHRDPTEKVKDIAKLIHSGSVTRLKEELAKCDVVCANCHRKRTAKMFGSWRSVLVEEKLFEGREEETVDESFVA